MRYIQDRTAIPVPFVLHWGTREESPLRIGPFIIMEYVNHEMNMTAALNTPGFTPDMRPKLDPEIDGAKLEKLYRQVADILLQISQLELPLIGALAETDEWQWEVTQRPLSKAMVDCEDESISSGRLQEEQRLSGKMRESWAKSDFWAVYASRKNFAFDSVYWKKLDSRFFGSNEAAMSGDIWLMRLDLLDDYTRTAMDSFVDKKMMESQTRGLTWEPDE